MCASSHIRGKRAAIGNRFALRREDGMTTIGLITLIAFIGIFAFAAIRLTPVYLNYLKVAGVVDGIHTEFDGRNPTRSQIRSSIVLRFDVEAVGEITARDITVTSVDGGFEVRAEYHHVAPFIGNVNFSVHFDKRALVRR